MDEYDIRATSIDMTVGLSREQPAEVIVARELGREVRLLVANQPTRGLEWLYRVRAQPARRGPDQARRPDLFDELDESLRSRQDHRHVRGRIAGSDPTVSSRRSGS